MREFAIVAGFVLLSGLTVAQHDARAASAADVEAYPVRPVRMILASGPGSAPDVIGRLLGNKLSEIWGRPIVVDNRPGATGLIAVETLAKSASAAWDQTCGQCL